MNEFIDTKFYEKYIKEIPIEEQIRGQVRAKCHYMDKADIYEWIAQDETKIMNLQSKIDKAIEYCEYNDESLYTFEPDYDYEENMVDNYEASNFREELLDILKDDNLESKIYDIKTLKESNKELYDVQFKLYQIIDKNINNLELTDEECIFLDYYNNKLNALYTLIDEQGETDNGKTADI